MSIDGRQSFVACRATPCRRTTRASLQRHRVAVTVAPQSPRLRRSAAAAAVSCRSAGGHRHRCRPTALRRRFPDRAVVALSHISRGHVSPGEPGAHAARPWEHEDPHAALTGTPPSPSAMPFSDGVFFDPWIACSRCGTWPVYQQHTALAPPADGVSLGSARPSTSRRHQHRVQPQGAIRQHGVDGQTRRRSGAIATGCSGFASTAGRSSAVHFARRRPLARGTRARPEHGDRSTMFYNPFRGGGSSACALTTRQASPLPPLRRGRGRPRRGSHWAAEGAVLLGRLRIRATQPARPPCTPPSSTTWTPSPTKASCSVCSRSIAASGHSREKPTDVVLGFSRDGFHWWRPWPRAVPRRVR